MALFPWRFQAEVAKGEADPVVTVFVGPERATLDENGDPTGGTFVEQSTLDPLEVPMSQLAGLLVGPVRR
jgi:hypothetical protein